MRIAVLCNSYPTKKNPHNQPFVKHLVQKFSHLDHEVTVCNNKIFDVLDKPLEKKGALWTFIKYSYFLISYILFFLKKNNRKTDVIFAHAIIMPGLVGVFLKKILKSKLAIYVHGGDLNSALKKDGIKLKVIKFVFRKSDLIISNSQDIYLKVHELNNTTPHVVISPGVDLSTFNMSKDKSRLRDKYNIDKNLCLILLAGNAIKRKGFDIFLRSYTKLKSKALFKSKVFIITEGTEKAKLKNFVIKHNFTKRVIFLNKMNQEQLHDYYCMADIFVFPSREEPLGLVGLEAMASGAVVVGSKIGGIKEYIKDDINGYLFNVGDIQALARILNNLIINNDNKVNLKANMSSTVAEHSLDRSVTKILDRFNQLLA